MAKSAFPKRLWECHTLLQASALAVSKQPTVDNLKDFEITLNCCLPENSNETAQYNFFRTCYKMAPKKWYYFITKQLKKPYMLLWTEARQIPTLYGLKDVVYVKYDKSYGYVVETYTPRNKHTRNNVKENTESMALAGLDVDTVKPTKSWAENVGTTTE